MNRRISVQEAARMLQTSDLTIRCGIEDGSIPIGIKVKKPGKKKANYLIYSEAVENLMKGIRPKVENTS